MDNKEQLYLYKKEYKKCENTNNYLLQAAKEGNKRIIKYIYRNYECSQDLNMAFRESCSNGHLDTAQWLYALDKKTKIHVDNEYAFIMSCQNGHLTTAQ